MRIEKKIFHAIKKSNVILLTSHERLDGDGVGGELAMRLALTGMGKTVRMINDGEAPLIYRFLPGAADMTVCPDGWRDDFDLCIALDSGSIDRLGKVQKKLPDGLPIINIDHHYSNTLFGAISWVGEEYSSAGEMIYRFMRANDIEITSGIAVCLYVAVITDTGRFCFSNTYVSTHEAIADLMRAGVDAAEVSRHLYRAERLEVVSLKNLCMSTLQIAADAKVAMMQVTDEMHRATGTNYLDTQDFVDIPKAIAGVEVGILFRQIDHDGKTRVSLRTEGGVNADKIAAEFGGGGHRRAAGFTYNGPIAAAREALVAVVVRHLREAGLYAK
jgi:phosphoesterase RecJ-like protein